MRKRLNLIVDEVWLSPAGTTVIRNSRVLQTYSSPIKINQEVSPGSRTLLNKVWQVINWWKLKAEEWINQCSSTISDAFKCLMRMNMTWVLYILPTLFTSVLYPHLSKPLQAARKSGYSSFTGTLQLIYSADKVRAELYTLGVFSRVLWIECDKLFVKICHVCRRLSPSGVASFLER